MSEIITWEQFTRPEPTNMYDVINRKITNILCPKCGKLIYKRLDMVCTSLPQQHRYECDCGWIGFSVN